MSLTNALPYFYAAGVQVITAFSAQLASSYTKSSFNTLLAQPMDYQPLRNGGVIPDGTPKGSLITGELSPAAVLKAAGRDRDIATIFTGFVFVIAPVALTATSSQVQSQIIIIVLVVVAVALAFGTWRWRKRLAARKSRPGILITNAAVSLLVLFNVSAGVYLLYQAGTPLNCSAPTSVGPTSTTPGP